jgi:SMODS and SLOG-associating 2TM effector domain 1/SMODS and SLOG-associating 2TM effector domain 3/CobQ/CobB/MinD/ParA nucleotide binding domain
MIRDRPPGRILTFYSYKGGTGRSMALANAAWILASNGHRVLVIDWDLEAPGLHRYLRPFLADPELAGTDGIIDLLTRFCVLALTPQAGEDPDWYRPLADLSRSAVTLNWTHFPADATLDFLPAGRQGAGYASRVGSFDWRAFYERLGGGTFLKIARDHLRETYDFVLIDSRTGLSDTSGICTVELPDCLVVGFTLNRQSVMGAAAVAASVRTARPDGGPRVFPVPMRVETGEKERLDSAREYSRARFDDFLGHLRPAQRKAYWGAVEVIYQPYYAFEEILATFGDRPGQANSVLAAIERMTRYVTDGAADALVPPPESERARILREYAIRRAPEGDGGRRTGSAPAPRQPAKREPVALAWQRHQEWSQLAWQRRRALSMRQLLELVCLVVAAGAAALAVQLGLGLPAGTVAAFVSALAVAVAVVIQQYAGQAGRAGWIRARSAAEVVASQVFMYLVGVEPFRGPDAAELLLQNTEAIQRDLLSYGPLDRPAGPVAEVPLPQVHDIESYVRDRIDDTLAYFRHRARWLIHRRQRLRLVGFGLGLAAATLAALGAASAITDLVLWVPVLTTAVSALYAQMAGNRDDEQATEYLEKATELERLKARRELRGVLADDDFVRACEQVITANLATAAVAVEAQLAVA